MARVLRATSGPTVLIGSDIPAITRREIAFAFRGLGACASVIGPASDGGYWLVGLNHPGLGSRGLFRNVRWSTEFTLEDTLPTLPHPVWQAAELSDVDGADDLKGA